MPEEYDKDSIWKLFREIRYCVLANQAGDGTTDVRTMSFSCSHDLQGFYMLSPKNARKINEFLTTPQATLHVYSIANNPDEFVQFVIKGAISIHREITTPELKDGLLMLAEKIHMLRSVQENGIPSDCVFLELRPKEIMLTRYLDILHNMPATKIGL